MIQPFGPFCPSGVRGRSCKVYALMELLCLAPVVGQPSGLSRSSQERNTHWASSLASLPDLDGDGDGEIAIGGASIEPGIGVVSVLLSGAGYRNGFSIAPAESEPMFGSGVVAGTSMLVVYSQASSGVENAVWCFSLDGLLERGLAAGRRVPCVRDPRVAMVESAAKDGAGGFMIWPSKSKLRVGSMVTLQPDSMSLSSLLVGSCQGDRSRLVKWSDMDCDGWSDFACTTTMNSRFEIAFHAFGSVSGKELAKFDVSDLEYVRPYHLALAEVDDFDGGGLGDLLLGGTGLNCGVLRVVSMETGRTLLNIREDSESHESNLFWSVLAVDDVDGDGTQDLMAGSPSSWEGQAGGRVSLYSGQKGEVLWSVEGEPVSLMGFSMCLVADVDEDGFRDVAVGGGSPILSKPVTPGFVGILSARTGRLLSDFPPQKACALPVVLLSE